MQSFVKRATQIAVLWYLSDSTKELCSTRPSGITPRSYVYTSFLLEAHGESAGMLPPKHHARKVRARRSYIEPANR
jgi:hypothetical protein